MAVDDIRVPATPTPPPVLMVTGEYPPMPGGVGAYTAELGKALAALGGRVGVLTGRAAADVPAHAGVTVYPLVARWDWRIWPLTLRVARAMGARWVHVQYQTGAYAMHPAVNFAPWWWRRQGVHVAVTYHDVLVPYLFPKAGAALRGWVTDRLAAASDLTIATNEGDRRYLARVARRLAHVPIGSNITPRAIDAATRRATRAAWGADDDTWLVGYFGFVNRSKGGLVVVDVLARLLATHPQARLLLIGEPVGAGDPTNLAYLREVEAAIARLGLADRVGWTGGLPDDAVSACLAACDVLLLPYQDGASTRRGTLMAGLAQGCAVVTTTPTAPLPELVDGESVLYVPPGDVVATTDAVRRLAADPALAARLRAGAQRAAAAFTWEGIAAAHVRLYHAA